MQFHWLLVHAKDTRIRTGQEHEAIHQGGNTIDLFEGAAHRLLIGMGRAGRAQRHFQLTF